MVKVISQLKKPVVLLLTIFYSLCLVTLFAWHSTDKFSVTGDEPHYLVMADGIARYRTLEQTRPYADELQSRNIFSWGLGEIGATPTPENTHAVQGPRGLFNVHNIGLPLLLAIPFAIAGTSGAKIFLILLSGIAVYCAWIFAQAFADQKSVAMLCVLAVTCSLPLIPAANQVYPDLFGGVFSLAALTCFFKRDRIGREKAKLVDALGLFAAAFLPWLHLKFAISSGLITLAFLYARLKQDRLFRSALFCVSPFLISIAVLAFYNLYAFGNPTGPYASSHLSKGALALNLQAVTVFFGLYVDQFQGILVQNPSLLVGLLFSPLFIRRNPLLGVLVAMVHLSFVLPNAMHTAWFGGYSFAGRFAWSGALVLVPVAIFALTEIAKDFGKKAYVLFAGLFSFQAVSYFRYSFGDFQFYNVRKIFSDEYPNFIPWLKGYMPMLYDSEWSLSYNPNRVWIATLLILLLLSIGYAVWERRAWFYRSALGVSLFGTLAGIISAPSVLPASALHVPALTLPSLVGEVDGISRVAKEGRDQAGFLSYGPRIILRPGLYRCIFIYSVVLPEGNTEEEPVVAYWDVFASPEGGILETGELRGAGGPTAFEMEFELPERLAESRLEMRVFWQGAGEFKLDWLVIKPILKDEALQKAQAF